MALITLNEIADYYGINAEDQDTKDVFEVLADRVSDLAETYCSRTFDSTEHTEYYNGNGSRFIYTNQYPITSVSGVWDSSDWDWDTDSLVDSDDYKTSNDSNSIILKSDASYFGDYIENVKIIYTAGYTTIPGDIKQVLIQEVIRWDKEAKSPHTHSSTSKDTTTIYISKELMPQTINVLNKYRSTRLKYNG